MFMFLATPPLGNCHCKGTGLLVAYRDMQVGKGGGVCQAAGNVRERLQHEGRVSHAHAQHGAAVCRQQGKHAVQQGDQAGAYVAAVCACILAASFARQMMYHDITNRPTL